ncbi:Uncharacterised protein [Bordetella pertussis]|nr:Uncharacterised protein [Bordetella pertussis]
MSRACSGDRLATEAPRRGSMRTRPAAAAFAQGFLHQGEQRRMLAA